MPDESDVSDVSFESLEVHEIISKPAAPFQSAVKLKESSRAAKSNTVATSPKKDSKSFKNIKESEKKSNDTRHGNDVPSRTAGEAVYKDMLHDFPAIWDEVDMESLRQLADMLVTMSLRPTQDEVSRDMLLHIFQAETKETQESKDPLGFGLIDMAALQLVQKGAASSKVSVKFLKKASSKKSTAFLGMGASASTADLDGTTPASLHAAVDTSKLQPHVEGFDPEAYLAVFHETRSRNELMQGRKALAHEMKQRTGQLKQLIRNNFDRFITCKNTIDDIHVRLQKVELESRGANIDALDKAMSDVEGAARRLLGPILERHVQAERIRSVKGVMRRFRNLFSMPARIHALTEAADFEGVIREYKKANSLIRPCSTTAQVWVTLYGEIEKRVTDTYRLLRERIKDPYLPAKDLLELLIALATLRGEQLPAAAEEDGMSMYLTHVEGRFNSLMSGVMGGHERAMSALREEWFKESGVQEQDDDSETAFLSWPGYEGLDVADLPDFLCTSLPPTGATLATVRGLKPDVPAWKTGHGSSEGQRPPRVYERLDVPLMPAARQWVATLALLAQVVAERVPDFWAVSTSEQYKQACATCPYALSREDAKRGARKILDGVIRRLVREVEVAVDVLSAAGPAIAALDLVLQVLARLHKDLAAANCPPRALDRLRGAVWLALGARTESLSLALEQLPAQLLASEAWQRVVGRPGTCRPTVLAEHLQTGTEHIMWRLRHIGSGQLELPGQPPPEVSWQPVQAGFLAMLSALTAHGDELVKRLQLAPLPKPGKRTGRKDPPSQPTSNDGSNAAAFTSAANIENDDATLLLLHSNLSQLRQGILPVLVERHKELLAGNAGEAAALQAALAASLADMKHCAGALLALYISRKGEALERILATLPPNATARVTAAIRVSKASQELLASLGSIASELWARCPSQLEPVLSMLVSRLLGDACQRADEGLLQWQLEELSQSYLDLSLLEAALRDLCASDLHNEVAATKLQMAKRIYELGRKTGTLAAGTPLMRALAGSSGREDAQRWLDIWVDTVVQPYLAACALNLRCFKKPQ